MSWHRSNLSNNWQINQGTILSWIEITPRRYLDTPRMWALEAEYVWETMLKWFKLDHGKFRSYHLSFDELHKFRKLYWVVQEI